MCYSTSIPPLVDATLNDPSMFVRHEAAIALGVVGNGDAKNALEKALDDPDKPGSRVGNSGTVKHRVHGKAKQE